MKPSRTRNQVSLVAYAVIAVGAAVLLVLADSGALRLAMTLVIVSAALGNALATYQLRHHR